MLPKHLLQGQKESPCSVRKTTLITPASSPSPPPTSTHQPNTGKNHLAITERDALDHLRSCELGLQEDCGFVPYRHPGAPSHLGFVP